MNRRKFNFLAATSVGTFSSGLAMPHIARAAISADKANSLKTTLTPMGAERAGNADGSIPAWTGGATTVPAGWTADQLVMPDMFASEQPLFKVDSSNFGQYSNNLSAGIKALIQKLGFSMNVYPTHRTAAAPQAVYDNIYQNALNAQPDPKGVRFGFSNAYGGTPFPIPSDDENQGGEIIWNHLTRWMGYSYTRQSSVFLSLGGTLQLGSSTMIEVEYPYYDPNGSLSSFDGTLARLRTNILAPPPLYGQELIEYDFTDPYKNPAEIWQLLDGQGRVRQAPELAFDTDVPGAAGIVFFDELNGFYGSPERYNWKSQGKFEIFIPCNNNGQFFKSPEVLCQGKFLNPDVVRWEKHRVWVVDATLAPGERNVVAHRRFYFDEDTWAVVLVDEYDAQGNLWKVISTYSEVRPDIPCNLYYDANLNIDLQVGCYQYGGYWNDPKYGSALVLTPPNAQLFNPQDMAAQAQY